MTSTLSPATLHSDVQSVGVPQMFSNDNETHHFSDKVTTVHAAMFLGDF